MKPAERRELRIAFQQLGHAWRAVIKDALYEAHQAELRTRGINGGQYHQRVFRAVQALRSAESELCSALGGLRDVTAPSFVAEQLDGPRYCEYCGAQLAEVAGGDRICDNGNCEIGGAP